MVAEHKRFQISIHSGASSGEMSVLFSGMAEPQPGHSIGPAIHDYFLIHTVLRGEGVFETGGRRYPCSEGDTFVIFPGVLFRYEAGQEEPWQYCWVAFKGSRSRSILDELGIIPENPVIRHSGGPLVRALYKQLRSSLKREDSDALADLEASGILRLLLTRFGEASLAATPVPERPLAESDRRLDRIISWLLLQYAQPISIQQIADTFGYHRTHLSRIFKEKTGLSPARFLLKVRMEKAKQLLSTALTITEVAASVGYADPLYFSKQFHRWAGKSPTDYRSSQASVAPRVNPASSRDRSSGSTA
ncbi:AraC family transcriptional regulator [Gorillibacterium timonense]|uniref:AraC family transcriptional regulator n=1 Tax=Gorillibacterium timonense TaxID=1689269 RepID=UPI0009E83A50|nr:AraC family transcriptional regulator [Gorillibacterium timonense]